MNERRIFEYIKVKITSNNVWDNTLKYMIDGSINSSIYKSLL